MSQHNTALHEHSKYKNKIKLFISELEQKLIERDEVIRVVILAFFSMQHIFLFGKPGVGKTYMARLASLVFGKDLYWELQVSYDTTTEQLMGGLVRDADGKTHRNTEKSLLDSAFPFLDEMFKANNKVLNSLLTPMLDRIYTAGSYTIPIPLITLFGASNEFPEGEDIKPFEDRFMFRYEILRIQDRENKRKYNKGEFDRSKNFKSKFSLDDIKHVYNESEHIIFPNDLLEEYIDLQDAIVKDGIGISDRKFGLDSAIKVFKVSAYLNDRNELNHSDLILLTHIAWHNLTDKKKLGEVMYNTIFGNKVDIEKIINDCVDEYKKLLGIYNADYDKLIKHGYEFAGQDSRLDYANALENITNYNKSLVKLDDKISQLMDRYNRCLMIEELCKNNIFLIQVKQTAFAGGTVDTITGLSKSVGALKIIIETWVCENKDLFSYNRIRNQNIFQMTGSH